MMGSLFEKIHTKITKKQRSQRGTVQDKIKFLDYNLKYD